MRFWLFGTTPSQASQEAEFIQGRGDSRKSILTKAVRATSRWQGLERFERRAMLSGVTLIAHGFDDNATDPQGWAQNMANAIISANGLQDSARVYIVKVNDTLHLSSLGTLQVVPVNYYDLKPGLNFSTVRDPEIFILLDWSDVAGQFGYDLSNLGPLPLGFMRGTGDVAAAVCVKLLQPNFLPGFAPPVASLPIHLIGHSRGGSLVSALAADLGSSGVWVDQVTTLDPHPISAVESSLTSPGVTDYGFSFSTSAASLEPTSNVIFDDNYYETSAPFIVGQAVAGAANNGPYDASSSTGLSLGGAYSLPAAQHNDVHLYYHGTIGGSTYDGSKPVPSSWYSNDDRTVTGFNYSSIAGGPRPAAGVSVLFGGSGARIGVQAQGIQWPNIAAITPQLPLNPIVGAPLSVGYKYQDTTNNFDVLFSLDTDQNPYDNSGNADASLTRSSRLNVAATGAAIPAWVATLDTSGLTVGTKYYICAEIKDNVNKRYSYYSTPIIFSPAAPATPNPTISSVTPAQFQVPSAGTTLLTINGSGFTQATTLVFTDPAKNVIPAKSAPMYVTATQLQYRVNVAGAAGNWQVQASNNGQLSNVASFLVQPSANSSSPAAPVGLTISPNGWSSSNQYTISWTNGNTNLAKVWVKVGSAPTFSADGTGYAYPASKSLTLNLAQDGYQPIFVWFEDAAGNRSANNYNVVAAERDTTGPTLTITGPTSNTSWVTDDGSVLLSGIAADSLSGVSGVTWSNNRGGTGVAAFSNGTWSVTSPVLLVSGANVLTVTATDAVGNTSSRSIQITHSAASIVPQNPTPGPGIANVPRLNPTFSWSGSALGGVAYSLLLQQGGTTIWNPYFGSFTGSSVTYFGSLNPGSTYNWQVLAKDNSGNIVVGPVWQFTTAYSLADTTPTNLTFDGPLTPGATVTGHLTVTNNGNYPSPGVFAKLYFSHTAGAKEIPIGSSSGIGVPGLNPGQSTTVDFQVTLDGMFAGPASIDAWLDDGLYASQESRLNDKILSIPVNYVDNTAPVVEAVQFNPPTILTGHTATIVYQATDDVGVTSVDLYASADGGANWQPLSLGYISTTPPANGAAYAWAVPVGFPITSSLEIKVIAHDAAGNTGQGTSAAYSVLNGTAPTITLTSPNGGQIWDIGTIHAISWTLSAPNGIRDLAIYFEHGSTSEWIQGADFSSDPGTYQWTIPNNASAVTTSGKIMITVIDSNGNQASVESNSYFTIHDTSAPPPAPWTSPVQVTVVPPTPAGQKTDTLGGIATDAAGNLYMGYAYNHSAPQSFPDPYQIDSTIYYKTMVGSTWSAPEVVTQVSQMVATVGTGVPPPPVVTLGLVAIVVTASGTPYMTWQKTTVDGSTTTEEQFYSMRVNGTWTAPTSLSNSADQFSYMPHQLYVDNVGKVYDVWFDWKLDQLSYRVNSGSGWTAPTALNVPNPNRPAITFDSSNILHLVYEQPGIGLTQTTFNGTAWTTPDLFRSTSSYVSDLQVATDSHNAPYVFWLESGDTVATNKLLFSRFASGVWSTPTTVSSGVQVNATAMSVDTLDRPELTYVAYNSANSPMLYYTTQLSGQWITPIQVNPNGQNLGNGYQEAFSQGNSQLYVAWSYFTNGYKEVVLSHADVSFTTNIFPPNVTVASPASGASVSAGATIPILWSATAVGTINSVTLAYSVDGGGTWNPIASGISNSGSYNWAVPNSVAAAAQIRVTATDDSGNSGVGLSSLFSVADVTAPTVTLLGPTGASTLIVGNSANISWSAADNVGVIAVNLDASYDGGTTWSPLTSNISNSGSYAWTVPNTLTTGLLIRVTAFDAVGLHGSSTSNSSLTVSRSNTAPVVPFNGLPAANLSLASNVGLALEWAGGDPDGNGVAYQLKFGTGSTLPTIWSGTGTRYVLGVLSPATTYFWQIIASDGIATTPGPVWSFTTAPAPLTAPPAMTATKGTFLDRVHLGWAPSQEAAGYEVWRSDSGDLDSAQLLEQVSALTYDDTTAAGSATYTYWVRPYDANYASGDFSVSDSGSRSLQLAFTQTPSTLYVGENLSSPVTVSVEDADGNLMADNSSTVTLTIVGGPGGGTATAQVQGGVATFTHLTFADVGTYLVRASDGSSVTTNASFAVTTRDGDATGDGKVDLNDLNIVLNNLGKTTTSRGDGNFDGAPTIDLNDLNAVLNKLGTSFVSNILPGDANGDGAVDLNDLNIVLNNLGTASVLRGNGNFDGAATIDLNDLNMVLNHLGTSSAGKASASGAQDQETLPVTALPTSTSLDIGVPTEETTSTTDPAVSSVENQPNATVIGTPSTPVPLSSRDEQTSLLLGDEKITKDAEPVTSPGVVTGPIPILLPYQSVSLPERVSTGGSTNVPIATALMRSIFTAEVLAEVAPTPGGTEGKAVTDDPETLGLDTEASSPSLANALQLALREGTDTSSQDPVVKSPAPQSGDAGLPGFGTTVPTSLILPTERTVLGHAGLSLSKTHSLPHRKIVLSPRHSNVRDCLGAEWSVDSRKLPPA